MSQRQPARVTSGKSRELGQALQALQLEVAEQPALNPSCCRLRVNAADWGKVAEIAAKKSLRFSASWGDHCPPRILIFSLFSGCDGQVLVETALDENHPQLNAQTPFFPAADRPERHIQDLLGVHFSDHPDQRRWTRHRGWAADEYPLRNDFPRAGHPAAETPADSTYPFPQIAGSGVYEIPVGPVHAGIIEPGHFRFQAVGETILRLEERLGYVHKGIEKIAVGRDLQGLIRLAARVSGDSSVAHSWAACQAAEQALGTRLPARALALRAIACERERIANHLGDIGAICNDVGFAFAQTQLTRLRELWQRDNAHFFGHRLLFDYLIAGGVNSDLGAEQVEALLTAGERLRSEVAELLPMLLEYPSLQDRLRNTGVLPPETASRLGVLGYVGRASNLQDDLRRDALYPPYDQLEVEVPAYLEGDIARRVRVRGDEILISIDLLAKLFRQLPKTAIAVPCHATGQQVQGLGLIEGWRGETLAYLRLDAQGRVLRYFPRDPSWLNWLALEQMTDGTIVPDFPACNKSVNGSYSGHDL